MTTRYLFLVPREDGDHMLLSKDGHILTTTDPSPHAPRIVLSDLTPIPSKDWNTILADAEDAAGDE